MRPQAHVASGLLLWSLGGGGPWEAPLIALAANLPDLDRGIAKRLGVKRRDHHRWVSHSFAGWAPPSVLALAAARGARHGATARRAVAGVWVHLAMDTYADGIAWLWPLREDKVGLFRKPKGIRDRGWATPAPLDSNLGQIEAAMWAAIVVTMARRTARMR